MEEPKLPKLPLRFLRWYCKDELIDEIEGDLIEVYQERHSSKPSKAKWKFYLEVLQSFNRRNIRIMEKYKHSNILSSWSMISQYAIVLLRSAKKSKVYTFISIVSLILGISIAGSISLYLNKELSYDQVFSNVDNIYRINHLSNNSGRSYAFAPMGMVPYLKENIEAVEEGTRIFKYRRALPITVKDTRRSFNEANFAWADPSFFKIFDVNMIQGNVDEVLNRPNIVAISQSTAKKYFRDKNPIGQVLIFNWEEETPLEVAGVFDDFPTNTSVQFDLVSNIETCEKTMWSGGWLKDWNNMFVTAYLSLKPGSASHVEEEVQNAISTYFTPDNPEAWVSTLQPLKTLHLEEPMDIGEWGKQNDTQTLILFSAIGLIILSLGCFNFTNMVTAQAGQRTKEVGVRKVLGGHKSHIAQQTLFETFVFVVFAGIVSILMIYLLLPKLGEFTGHSFGLSEILNFEFITPFIVTLALVTLISGAYPALFISRIQSLHLMKSFNTSGGKTVRNVLVTSQFTITTGLVICTLMAYLQLEYLRDKELGFDQSTIINIPIHNDEAIIPKINAFRNEVTAYSGIKNVTASSHEMFSDYTYMALFDIEGIEENHRWERYTVEQDFIKTFDLEIIAGRGFDRNIISDSVAFVLNESAVKALGLSPEEIINKTITDTGLNKTGKIVGVTKDFHYRSLHHSIQPFILYINWERLDYISVSLQSNNLMENIDQLEKGWYATFSESIPFFFNFLDQQTADLYKQEANESQLFTLFSLISIILGTMGLFGFALFTTEKRFKEIGLRKVLGAGTWQLIILINQNFIKILVISFVLAAPISFLLVGNWLEAFAYRIEQPIWVYVITGITTFLLASLTVSYLSWKAASSNPVDAIKVE